MVEEEEEEEDTAAMRKTKRMFQSFRRESRSSDTIFSKMFQRDIPSVPALEMDRVMGLKIPG